MSTMTAAPSDGRPDGWLDRYLERLGLAPETVTTPDLPTLQRLQRTHMEVVPFENLDVYTGVPVATDLGHSLTKLLERRRGGWCFEVNGAFSALLEALGYRVTLLGAAVLLSGPTEVIDHLCLEVLLDEPYLVDVGFGDGFHRPLALNRRGPQDGGCGRFELVPSPRGTTLTRDADDGLSPQYRFKRVAHTLDQFEPASAMLQADKTLNWHRRAFATRLLEDGSRVGLTGNRLTLRRPDGALDRREEIPDDRWGATLDRWFGLEVPLGGPAHRGDPGDRQDPAPHDG